MTIRSVKVLAPILALLLAAGALSGCNTAEGFGRDVEATGNAIGDAARDTKDALSD